MVGASLKDIRARLDIPTIKTTIIHRRLAWLQNMILHHDENLQFFGALVGKMDWSKAQLTNIGQITEQCFADQDHGGS